MFERLFELFLHAKTGVIAGVFLIGTTGALVTATVQNGVTTITITQASPSPSGSALISPSTAASPAGTTTASPSATASPTGSPSSSPSSNPNCKSQAQAAADATKTVDQAFMKFHTDLMHLRELNKSDAARKTIEDADKQLKKIRQNAIKAIHASTACFRRDDDQADKDTEDEDKNDDNDEQTTTVTVAVSASPTPVPSPTPSAPPTDPKTIATQAVAAMKLVFDTAVAQLPPTTTASPRVRITERPDRTARPDPSPKKEGERD